MSFISQRSAQPCGRGRILNLFLRLPVFLLLIHNTSLAQCPPNIDFENGTFDNWTCYIGNVAAVNGQNEIQLIPTYGPFPGRHTIIPAGNRDEYDFYGGFPVVCPNGSGYSVRLGSTEAGGQAEGISYEFTIPAGQDVYSLIYHYAVVFEDPLHEIFQQPRLEIEITNVTDSELIHCSSFTFIPHGTILPGFYISPNVASNASVWCKDWSAVSVNLNGLADKTIRLFFKTGDCTFTRHFGYAYIDVNTECSSEFVGATYCREDTTVMLTAPYGYQNYTWFGNNFSQVLSNQQSVQFTPPPPAGTSYAVEIVPYDGYGCKDTLYARLIDTLTVKSNAGKDVLSCNETPMLIGANPVPGLAYSWWPEEGLSDPAIANPLAKPATPTHYILTTSSRGGGCDVNDTVFVDASIIHNDIGLIGKDSFCIDKGDSAVLFVDPTYSIQWHYNNNAISGATQTHFRALRSGSYHAFLVDEKGCSISTESKTILIEIPKPGMRYPVVNAVTNIPLQLESRDFGSTIHWEPPFFLNNPFLAKPVFTGNQEREYTIELTTPGGCLTVDTQLVKVFKEIKFYVPTAFTPNSDGLNDYLKPIQAGIKELRYFRVFNRWGQLIFDLSSDTRGWDGRLNGVLQGSQVYVWIAEGIGIDNNRYVQKGTCLLIR